MNNTFDNTFDHSADVVLSQNATINTLRRQRSELEAKVERYEAALNRILDNCSDTDLVNDTASEALYGLV